MEISFNIFDTCILKLKTYADLYTLQLCLLILIINLRKQTQKTLYLTEYLPLTIFQSGNK